MDREKLREMRAEMDCSTDDRLRMSYALALIDALLATPAPEPAAAPAVGEGPAPWARAVRKRIDLAQAALEEAHKNGDAYRENHMATRLDELRAVLCEEEAIRAQAALSTPAPAAGLVTAEMVNAALDTWERTAGNTHAVMRKVLTAALSARQEGGA